MCMYIWELLDTTMFKPDNKLFFFEFNFVLNLEFILAIIEFLYLW